MLLLSRVFAFSALSFNTERNTLPVATEISGVSIHLVVGRIIFLGNALVTSGLKTAQWKSQSLFSVVSLNIIDQSYQLKKKYCSLLNS